MRIASLLASSTSAEIEKSIPRLTPGLIFRREAWKRGFSLTGLSEGSVRWGWWAKKYCPCYTAAAAFDMLKLHPPVARASNSLKYFPSVTDSRHRAAYRFQSIRSPFKVSPRIGSAGLHRRLSSNHSYRQWEEDQERKQKAIESRGKAERKKEECK